MFVAPKNTESKLIYMINASLKVYLLALYFYSYICLEKGLRLLVQSL